MAFVHLHNHTEYSLLDGATHIYDMVKRDKKLNPGKSLKWMELDVDGEEVGIHYGYKAVPFDRIRRITGYLVGTLDRFNDAKRSEEHDRVKHGVSCSCGH